MSRFLCVICLLFCVCSPSIANESTENSNTNFSLWLAELKNEAIESGISAELVHGVLDDVEYMERIISADRSQAEFKESYAQYLSKRVSEYRIRKGREYLLEYGDQITEVTKRYGVPARFVVAIIGIETNYGTFTLKHSMFNVLATLAYDLRRGARFRKEIFAALKIIDRGEASLDQLRSSWAGALGVPQFMPSTYLQFAQDFDGDGTKNIWQHGPDLWASVANYLSHYGWNEDQAWARKVLVPVHKRDDLKLLEETIVDIPKDCLRYKKHLKVWDKLEGWNTQGIRRMNGTDLPDVDIAAAMILTDRSLSHAYLVYENFCTLMRYNPSFKYALAVGSLSDALK